MHSYPLTKAARKAPILAAGLCAAVLAMGASSATAGSLVLDNPNQTVALPSSGFVNVTFSGTVTVDPGFTLEGVGLDQPADTATSSVFLGAGLGPDVYFGTHTGPLFYITVNATDLTGLYSARFQFGEIDAHGATQNFQTVFTVDVTPAVATPTASVPEPAEWTLMLTGFAGMGGALRMARRKPAVA